MLADINKVPETFVWPQLVWDLAASPHVFSLGGSHYFGCAGPESDIDFITAYSDDAVVWLESKGFTRMTGKSDVYNGGSTTTYGVFENGIVQVQVKFNIVAALQARTIMATHFAEEHRKADKETRTLVWTALIDACDNIAQHFAYPPLSAPF